MNIAFAIGAVRDGETELVEALGRIGERHRADHDVFHLSRTLIGVHRANLEALAPFGERYGTAVDGGDAEADGGLPARAREKASDLVARRSESGLLLLRDLRELHLLYAEASIDWVILNQAAQAMRDGELAETVAKCHAETLRGMKWTVTRLKTTAPQVLSG